VALRLLKAVLKGKPQVFERLPGILIHKKLFFGYD
jgi:hypothetical protein